MTISAARKIYETARNTERRDFRIEDMLFTGIFRQKAGIEDIRPLSMPGKNKKYIGKMLIIVIQFVHTMRQ